MATKGVSSRAGICGRGGGGSAVDVAAYISRKKMYSEYDGVYHVPKYKEDLVHCEVMLPENAPAGYKDPEVLWNSAEMCEKSADAQCARTLRLSLPNDWSHDLAIEVARDYIKRNFTDRGMYVFYAIHDSVNDRTGDRNLHMHIMLTMRGIDENGKWMSKQKKIYLTDKNGDRIPLIDKKTGKQKVDKQNRKQWKCSSVPTNDWNNRENVRKWRKDLADTINAVNEKTGQTENFWEYRSFKEQGVDTIPQIHLGPRVCALERRGIMTDRGNINREIIMQNSVITAARNALTNAERTLEKIRADAGRAGEKIRNEIFEMISRMAERYNNRLRLPVMNTKYIRKIPNRSQLQDREFMESFVARMGWESFAEMRDARHTLEAKYEELSKARDEKKERLEYLEKLMDYYEMYEPYHQINAEYWKLRKAEERNGKALGFGKKSRAEEYRREHNPEMTAYRMYRDILKDRIMEPDKKIVPRKWREEIAELKNALEGSWQEYSDAVWVLAGIETLEYNQKDLKRMIENEGHKLSEKRIRNRDIE